MSDYKELNVWVETRRLCSDVHKLTKAFPSNETYGLTSQIRRCAVSVPSNIAEGCGRNTVKDSMQFFYIARGSMYELETQLFIAFDLEYLTKEELTVIQNEIVKCKKILAGFINYHKSLK